MPSHLSAVAGPELPDPVAGAPTRVRPEGMGDTGAWVSQVVEKTRANVTRTLTLVPVTNGTWRTLVDSHYTRGPQFFDLALPEDAQLTLHRLALVLQRLGAGRRLTQFASLALAPVLQNREPARGVLGVG